MSQTGAFSRIGAAICPNFRSMFCLTDAEIGWSEQHMARE
jgi:hypothetical protein